MSQNNSNNDSEQIFNKNQHKQNFISPAANSGNETGRKENGKAGDLLEEPAEKVVGKAKYSKPSPKRRSQGKKTTSSSSKP